MPEGLTHFAQCRRPGRSAAAAVVCGKSPISGSRRLRSRCRRPGASLPRARRQKKYVDRRGGGRGQGGGKNLSGKFQVLLCS